MSKPRTLTLKTRQGSRRLAILFAALILLFGFAARMVETHNGAVKIEDVTIDAHGAQLSCRLYYPAYTDHNDKLPAVLTVHGYVCNGGVTKGIAEEIAKRGFVVLNVSGYGTGMSEMPEIDASGHGRYAQMGFGTDTGMYDALNFVRSLQFVDTTRIGMVGHSMGSARTDSTALLDCTFLTVNDQKLNILHNTFGVEIAEGELYADADAIAQAKLNPDQLTYYQHLCEEYTEDFNSTLKAICLLGTGARTSLNQKEVEVAGHTVKRALKTNMIYVSGEFDSIWNFGVVDANKANLNTAEDIQDGFWYALDEQNGTSAILGRMTEVGVADSPELKAAFEARMIRGYEKVPGITHSKEYFDNETNTLIVNYFTQALDYNHGSLTEGTAQPYDPVHNTWWIRVAFNCLGMLSMFALLISLAGWLLKSEVFADLVVQPKDGPQYKDPVNKKRYWLIALVSAVGCGWAIYFSVKNWSKAKVNEILRFVPITGSTIFYLLGASIVAILVLVFLVYTTRKKHGGTGLAVLNFKMPVKKIVKTFLLVFLLGGTAYTSLLVLNYFFGQDYRLWEAVFTFMPAEYWVYCIPYALMFLPMYLIIGASGNYAIRKDQPQWKETLIFVVSNSLGVWVVCLINYLLCFAGEYTGTLWCNFIVHYGFLMIVPLTVYITRRLYLMTNSIWAGALLNTFLVCWTMASNGGTNTIGTFTGQTWLSIFFH